MKRILHTLTLACALICSASMQAQLPSGSFVPNFEATDIYGETHNLYEYLAQGYEVIIDVSATWCGPCWSYHTGGALEEVWATYGPDGTDEVIVIMIEGDDSTTAEDLVGTGTATQGDWTAGTDYPIIDDAGWIANLLEISYYPTIYTVCADGLIYETGQVEAEEHIGFIQALTCEPAMNDLAVTDYTGTEAVCESPFNASVDLTNVGEEGMINATITMTGCDECPIDQDFSGNLANWETTSVDFGSVNADSDLDLEFFIESDDDNPENNALGAAIAVGAVDATTWWTVEVTTDCWPGETSWFVIDESGAIVQESEAYTEQLTEYSTQFELPSLGCYTFVFNDAYGDGLNGSQYTSCGVDGNAHAYTASGSIWSTDGSNAFSQEVSNANANSVGIDEVELAASLSIYPNPVQDQATIQFNLAASADVAIDVMNMVGQNVAAVDFGNMPQGNFQHELNLSDLAAGVYIVNIQAGPVMVTEKITVAE